MAYFPFLIDMKNRKCLVVGAGQIARAKMRTFIEFGADVTCISKQICQMEHVHFIRKEIELSDLDGYDVVVAATDDHTLNHQIAKRCMELGIMVNAVDQKDDCSFIFPSIIHHQDIVASFSSGGNNPVITQYMKQQASSFIDERLGEINAISGEIRRSLMDLKPQQRKQIMREMLDDFLKGEETDDEIRKRYLKCGSE